MPSAGAAGGVVAVADVVADVVAVAGVVAAAACCWTDSSLSCLLPVQPQ